MRRKNYKKIEVLKFNDGECSVYFNMNDKTLKFEVQPYYYEYVKNQLNESENIEQTYNELASIGYLSLTNA